MTDVDARALNWRFVLPDEPLAGWLLLPASGAAAGSDPLLAALIAPETTVPQPTAAGLAAALARGPYPAVAAPDLGVWSGLAHQPAGALLADLCAAVAPGGWLLAGFHARWASLAAGPGTGLSASAVRGTLRAGGLPDARLYLPLPGLTQPAFLVPEDRSAELDHVLRRHFIAYAPGGSLRSAARRRAMLAARALALRAPRVVRTGLAPAHYVVARRTP